MALRNEAEITKAHNTLHAALKAFRSVGVHGELVRKIELCIPVLCWVLQHPGGDNFDMSLLGIEELILGAGEN